MRQLGHPTLFCHKLSVDESGAVRDYHLRQKDPKRASVKALHSLNYRIIAAGDSYNDTVCLRKQTVASFSDHPKTSSMSFPSIPLSTIINSFARHF